MGYRNPSGSARALPVPPAPFRSCPCPSGPARALPVPPAPPPVPPALPPVKPAVSSCQARRPPPVKPGVPLLSSPVSPSCHSRSFKRESILGFQKANRSEKRPTPAIGKPHPFTLP